MITVLRPLSTSELLDRTFHLYRNNFLMFVGITAIPQLAAVAVMLGGAALMLQKQASTSMALTVGGYLLFYLAIFISQAPTISAVSNLHMEKPASIGSSYSIGWRTFLRVLWIVFLIFVIAFGLILLVSILVGAMVGALAATGAGTAGAVVAFAIIGMGTVLAVRWMLNWSLVIPVTVLEGGGFRPSIRRSKALAKGSRWRIFGVYFLMGVFAFVVALMIQFLLSFSLALLHTRDLQTMQAAMQAIQAIGLFISTSVVGALATIALSLIYYDQRVRKEGFDLQLMVAALQPVSGTASVAPEASSVAGQV